MTDDEKRELIDAAEMHQQRKLEPMCDEPDCGCGDFECQWCGDEWPCLTRRLADALEGTLTEPERPEPRRRLRACVEAWPECQTSEYNPSCCRFPKSCSATVYDEDRVRDPDLEVPDI